MRILMISEVPFVRELGAGRVQLECGEALAHRGHEIEFFDARRAFGDAPARDWHRLTPLRFARRARSFVRSSPSRWDVIDAEHGDLPYGKRALGFRGALVARSSGLYAFYQDYVRFERSTWSDLIPGSRLGQFAHRLTVDRRFAAGARALRLCDAALVPNSGEHAFVAETLGLRDRCHMIPLGLTDSRARAFAEARHAAADRLSACRVAFVGSWSLRKGAADWPRIVRRIRTTVPNASFTLLGTGRTPDEIRQQFDPSDRTAIDVVPWFQSSELPELLAGVTVGAFPSYAEAFGFGVLEQLAAGLPTVAYDIPGPRDLLSGFESALVPVGDADGLADRIAGLLGASVAEYAELSDRCVAAVASYRWGPIAATTEAAYHAALNRA